MLNQQVTITTRTLVSASAVGLGSGLLVITVGQGLVFNSALQTALIMTAPAAALLSGVAWLFAYQWVDNHFQKQVAVLLSSKAIEAHQSVLKRPDTPPEHRVTLQNQLAVMQASHIERTSRSTKPQLRRTHRLMHGIDGLAKAGVACLKALGSKLMDQSP